MGRRSRRRARSTCGSSTPAMAAASSWTRSRRWRRCAGTWRMWLVILGSREHRWPSSASEVDLRVFYASDGRRIELDEEQAVATVRRYLADVAGDSGVAGASLAGVRVERLPGRPAASEGPTVTVELRAVAPVAFLRLLHLVAPVITGRATATAEVVT